MINIRAKSPIVERLYTSIAGLERYVFFLAIAIVVIGLFNHLWALAEQFANYRWEGLSLGIYSQYLWNLSHGHFYSSIVPSNISFESSLILIFLAPFYRLMPDPYLLAFFQSVIFFLSAIALYYLCTQYIKPILAFLLVMIYFFYPPWAMFNSASFYPALLSLPFLFIGILALIKKRQKLYLSMMSVVILCDSHLFALVAFMVIPVILYKMNKKWIFGTMLIALLGCLFSIRSGFDFFISNPHIMGLVIVPLLIWGACFVLKNKSTDDVNVLAVKASTIIFTLIVFMITTGFIYSKLSRVTPFFTYRDSAIQWLISNVPDDSSIIVSEVFLPQFVNRKEVFCLTNTANTTSADYLLVDLNDGQDTSQYLDTWQPFKSVGDVLLLQKKKSEDQAENYLYKRVNTRQDSPYLVINAAANDDLLFVGFTMEPNEDNQDIIEFTFYWQKLKRSQRNYQNLFSIVTFDGKVAQNFKKLLCYNAYPFSEWKVGEIIKEKYQFVVPIDLLQSSYEVRLGVIDDDTGKAQQLKSDFKEVIDPWGNIKLIALDAV